MDGLPPASVPLIPIVRQEVRANWPELVQPSFIAAQIDKETCISPTHRLCWNPRAELKTSREYGFGLGQVTTAYSATGAVRFNKFEELKAQFPRQLLGWTWEKRFEAEYQIRAMTLMSRQLAIQCSKIVDSVLECTFASYNGGFGGFLSDQRLCGGTPGCNSRVWFGNIENHSLKQKTAVKGYGESFFDINRRYVREVIADRRWKYEPHLDADEEIECSQQ